MNNGERQKISRWTSWIVLFLWLWGDKRRRILVTLKLNMSIERNVIEAREFMWKKADRISKKQFSVKSVCAELHHFMFPVTGIYRKWIFNFCLVNWTFSLFAPEPAPEVDETCGAQIWSTLACSHLYLFMINVALFSKLYNILSGLLFL